MSTDIKKTCRKTAVLTTGGLLLSTLTDADAAIVYSGLLNTTVNAGGYQDITIRTTGPTTLRGWLRTSYGPNEGFIYQQGNSIYVAHSGATGASSYKVINFAENAAVTAASWISTRGKIFSYKSAAFNTNLNFNNLEPGYIGFRINPPHDNYYGWMYIDSIAADGSSFVVRDWAYDDTGGSIKAGQKTDGGSAVPEPSGLALLACGAAGVYALRRKCKEEQDR